MNTRKAVAVAATVAVLLVASGVALDQGIRHRLIEPLFVTLEQQEGRDDVFRAVQALEREIYHLGLQAVDWGEWDDTYRYVHDRNPDYEKANIQMADLVGGGIDLLYIIDERGTVVNGRAYDSDLEREVVLQSFPIGQLKPGNFLHEPLRKAERDKGLVVTERGPLLIAVHPILRTNGTGPARGILVLGRFLREKIVSDIRSQTRVDFELNTLAKTEWSDLPVKREALSPGEIVLAPPASSEKLDGYAVLADLEGRPALLLHAELPRLIFAHGTRAARFVSVVIMSFTAGLVLLLSAALFFVHFWGRRQRNRTEKLVEQRTAELAASERRLQVMADAAFEGILLLEDGLCLMMNRRAEEMFGYSSEELFGKTTALLVHPSDHELVRRNVERNYSKPYEVLGQRKTGEIFPLAIYGKSMEYEGKVVRAAGLRDLSEQKSRDAERALLEDRLRRAQKMETIGLMAGGVAHDLNNILSGLVTYPELLMMKLPEDSPLYGPLKTIHSAGKRAADVVADLLTVARGVAMNIQPENLNGIIEEYLHSPEHEKLRRTLPDVRFSAELSSQLPNILGSSAHIGKSLMNLVVNGAEAINGEGGVSITTHCSCVDQETAVEFGIKAGVYAVLSVSDTGTGIAARDLEHIFEPFYTRKVVGRSGTGLGLAVVWNTMQDHKGCVRVLSDEGGSCFELYFPATDKQSESPLKAELAAYTGRGELVLVVDDNSEQLVIASSILKALNYSVATADSGEQAVAFLQNHSVDLVILDMLMEPGMNGYETYLRIIRDNPKQKALIASGYSESDEVRKTLELGAGFFIQKPYSVAQMGRALLRVLYGGGAIR